MREDIPHWKVWEFLNDVRELKNPERSEEKRLSEYKNIRSELEYEMAGEEKKTPGEHRYSND